MLKLFVRVWHYTAAALTSLFNEKADPRIQIEQAIEEARQHHRRLTDSAAAVIANRMEIEIKVARTRKDLRELEARTTQAVRLAEQARASGDAAKAGRLDRSAEIYATQLASKESSLSDLEEVHERASVAASAATRVVDQSKMQVQQQLVEKTRLLNDLAAAEMQKRIADALKSMDQFAPDGTIPTLPKVRERIDAIAASSGARIAVAMDDIATGGIEVERGVRDRRGAEILEEIRRREGLPTIVKGERT
jgi:phage shock protein A